MTTLWQRFVFIDRRHTAKVNLLSYPFVLGTLVYGLGFLFGGEWSGVNSSSLYTALYGISHGLPAMWGLFAVFAALLSLGMVLFRARGPGEVASMSGCLVWMFASFVYLVNGFWLVLFTVSLTYLSFWVYFYFEAKKYQRLRH